MHTELGELFGQKNGKALNNFDRYLGVFYRHVGHLWMANAGTKCTNARTLKLITDFIISIWTVSFFCYYCWLVAILSIERVHFDSLYFTLVSLKHVWEMFTIVWSFQNNQPVEFKVRDLSGFRFFFSFEITNNIQNLLIKYQKSMSIHSHWNTKRQ